MKQPTPLQRRVLRLVLRVSELNGRIDAGRMIFSSSVHESAQVVSRAINLCRASGWLRIVRDQELRLTAAGRRALEAEDIAAEREDWEKGGTS